MLDLSDESTVDAAGEALLVDLDGFEGPLDLLLTLARQQKVDLREISMVQLAEQYLAFIETARRLRLEVAADYLVAAAWLAYLKSRLLLPPEENAEEAEDAAALAEQLAFQLERLEAMRKVAARLFARDRLGRDVFARGAPEATVVAQDIRWDASLLDLLRAHARCQTRAAYTPLHVERPKVCAMEEAMQRLNMRLGTACEWATLASYLPPEWCTPPLIRSAVASTFAAMLELARDGAVTLRQEQNFGEIWLRPREAEADAA